MCLALTCLHHYNYNLAHYSTVYPHHAQATAAGYLPVPVRSWPLWGVRTAQERRFISYVVDCVVNP